MLRRTYPAPVPVSCPSAKQRKVLDPINPDAAVQSEPEGIEVNVLLLHAYSSLNQGDGLLVDLALEFLRDALGKDTEIDIIAMDAKSFSHLEHVHQLPAMSGTPLRRSLDLIGMIVRLLRCHWFGYASLAPGYKSKPELIVGVGGGYMRAEGSTKSVKAFIAHGVPMSWALSTGIPTYYLSQSVGPFRGLIGHKMRHWLGRVDRLLVRDDRSLALYPETRSVVRAPDMAIFSIARTLKCPADPADYPTGRPRLIARDLDRPSHGKKQYLAKLHAMIACVPHIAPAIQSAGRGNDDPAFYERMGWGKDIPLLRDLIASERPKLVISVRLHGALESIRAGIPAIHLSYERKGFGAYADLGVSEFVHNVNDFDLDLVIAQAGRLLDDPSAFWDRVREQQPRIVKTYDAKLSDLRAIAGNTVGLRA